MGLNIRKDLLSEECLRLRFGELIIIIIIIIILFIYLLLFFFWGGGLIIEILRFATWQGRGGWIIAGLHVIKLQNQDSLGLRLAFIITRCRDT